jgi:predicted transcriptional regulator
MVRQTNRRQANRDREQILSDVIGVCYTGSKKTLLMKRCNLNFVYLKAYLEVAKRGHFLTEEKGIYIATEKGKLYTQHNELLLRLLSTGKNNDPYSDSKLREKIENIIHSLQYQNLNIESNIMKLVKTPENIEIEISGERRGRYSIIEEILDKATGGTLKSYIMKGCNLSFNLLDQYLFNLGITNMIEQKEKIYKTILKGILFVNAHRLQRKLLLDVEEDKDPFLDSKLVSQIEAVLKPLLSAEIPKDVHLATLLSHQKQR